MTNLVLLASVILHTNIVERLHPSGQQKITIETVTAHVSVPFVFEGQSVILTNMVVLKMHTTTQVWQAIETNAPIAVTNAPAIPAAPQQAPSPPMPPARPTRDPLNVPAP